MVMIRPIVLEYIMCIFLLNESSQVTMGKPDALLCLEFDQFQQLGPSMNIVPQGYLDGMWAN